MENLLGKKVKDKITGLEGIAVTECTFLNGCVQYAIQAKIGKDGKIPDEKWIDEQQLEVVEPRVKKAIKKIKEYRPTGGGFRSYPI